MDIPTVSASQNDYLLGDAAMDRRASAEKGQLYFEFKVDKQKFLVSQYVRCEYIRSPQIFALPLMPACLKGLINVRGLLIPVFDLSRFLGNQSTGSNVEYQHALVLDKGEDAAAMVVAQPPKVTRYADEDCVQIDESVSMPSGACEYKFKRPSGDLYVLNHKFLFESLSQFDFNLQSSEG